MSNALLQQILTSSVVIGVVIAGVGYAVVGWLSGKFVPRRDFPTEPRNLVTRDEFDGLGKRVGLHHEDIAHLKSEVRHQAQLVQDHLIGPLHSIREDLKELREREAATAEILKFFKEYFAKLS